jgi:hypothetical protein
MKIQLNRSTRISVVKSSRTWRVKLTGLKVWNTLKTTEDFTGQTTWPSADLQHWATRRRLSVWLRKRYRPRSLLWINLVVLVKRLIVSTLPKRSSKHRCTWVINATQCQVLTLSSTLSELVVQWTTVTISTWAMTIISRTNTKTMPQAKVTKGRQVKISDQLRSTTVPIMKLPTRTIAIKKATMVLLKITWIKDRLSKRLPQTNTSCLRMAKTHLTPTDCRSAVPPRRSDRYT